MAWHSMIGMSAMGAVDLLLFKGGRIFGSDWLNRWKVLAFGYIPIMHFVNFK